jgi:hypothetical protein
MICIAALYIVLCFIVALRASDRKFGFWVYFFCSLALTPFIVAIVLVASDKRPKQLKKCPKCSCTLSEQ